MSFEFVSYFGFRASNLHFCLTLVSFAPWNTDSTKIELFARSAIPQGSPRGVLISTQAEYDPQGVTPPRRIPPRQKIYRFRREVIPRGESSFIRFPKLKFNGKFQICLASFSTGRSPHPQAEKG